MDTVQAIATSIGVIGLILLMVLLVFHFFGPRTAAWIHSNREEKIGFSKNRIYHANGYLIQSGSELLLNSTGSFKRFDSIDRDYKKDERQVPSPSWNITVPEIPPQPLRPAPQSPTFRDRNKFIDKLPQIHSEPASSQNSIVPRPVTKRQMSSPANCGVSHINLSDVVAKINNGPKSCTNPFRNGSLSISEDDNSNNINNQVGIDEKLQKNPFSEHHHEDNSFFSFPSNGNIDVKMTTDDFEITDTTDTLIEINDATANGTATHLEHMNNSPTIQIQNRSLSDAGSSKLIDKSATNPFSTSDNLHKTVSDTYLEQYSMQKKSQHTNSFSRTPSHQSMRQPNSPQTPVQLTETELKRAMSCESVNSDSSVVLADLEQQIMPKITGQLCVGLQYDKNTLTDEGIELVLTVMEAKELIGPPDAEQFDTFVRIYMVPDDSVAQHTKLFRNSRCPSYNETISFWLSNKKHLRRSLWFHVYHSGNAHTLIGETEFQIGDVSRPITTWMTLYESRHNISPYGELMFSLSYLRTAERLTVVVVKARNLKLNEDDSNGSTQNVFVKVYLQKDDKKVLKKKTGTKRADSCITYNESMTFSVPPYMLNAIQIRLTMVSVSEASTWIDNSNSIVKPIGHVIVGYSTSDKGEQHWNQMMMSLRKPVAMWHAIRHAHVTEKNAPF